MGAEQHFPARLRELREAAGLTQQALADASGLTREGVAQLETGRRSPTWATVLALASALGIKTDSFAQSAASNEYRGPGRPAKAPGSAQDERGADLAADIEATGKTSGKGKGRRRKGG
jgi:transcriptional regulator with XRE-family HTH domain